MLNMDLNEPNKCLYKTETLEAVKMSFETYIRATKYM